MQVNEVLNKLPKHLHNLIIDQPYNQYTAKDHAVWRYVMRQNVKFFTKMAYGDYLKGLESTGVSINEIPKMYGMNRILKDIGWAAAAVDGFIPPQAFMEFQAYKVLVIAADIRTANHIEYTPAPDILHEAAGHAPIIADPEYALYLEKFGKIGAKAFSSAADNEAYEAIRHLSIIKEYPDTKPEEIQAAEAKIAEIEKNTTYQSEMSRLRNLHWWTVEYGLIGSLDDYRIYGAGLLSSIQESQRVPTNLVEKRLYDIKAADVSFDITTMQPQLYVTPSFKHLNTVLDEFASQLAFNTGGKNGFEKAIISQSTATVEFNNNVQLTGTFSSEVFNEYGISFIKSTEPSQISFKGKQLIGHAKENHQHGYSMPLGQWLGVDKSVTNLTQEDASSLGVKVGAEYNIAYEIGIKVVGTVANLIFKEGVLVLIKFTNCTVTHKDKVLFLPEWGDFDLIVATEITSCYPGPADPEAFGWSFEPPTEVTKKIIHTPEQLKLYEQYQTVKTWREDEVTVSNKELEEFSQEILKSYPSEWLLLIETAELLAHLKHNSFNLIETQLLNIAKQDATKSKLITDGLQNLV